MIALGKDVTESALLRKKNRNKKNVEESNIFNVTNAGKENECFNEQINKPASLTITYNQDDCYKSHSQEKHQLKDWDQGDPLGNVLSESSLYVAFRSKNPSPARNHREHNLQN